MPYITKEQRAQGGWVASTDGVDLETCAPYLRQMLTRVLPMPDQSRYGTATTDPLGREGPGWTKGAHGLPVRVKDEKGSK